MLRAFWMSVASALALLPTLAYAQPQLALELTAPSEGFVLGQPVVLHARLTNRGSEPTEVMGDLKPEFGAVVYEITRRPGEAAAERFRFTPWAIIDRAEPMTRLPPGQSLEQDVDLFYDGKHWVFREPGTYQVEAVYLGHLRSNALTFRIVAPRNEAETTAARLMLDSPAAARFLALRGGDHLRQGMEALQNVASLAPNTPHAVHANLALGLSQLQSFADFANNRLRPAEPRVALQYLEKVDESVAARTLGAEGITKAIIGQAQAHRLLNAESRAQELERKLPDVLRNQFPTLNLPRFEEHRLPDIRKQLQQR